MAESSAPPRRFLPEYYCLIPLQGGCLTCPTSMFTCFSEGDATMRNLLGGKGANLAEMTNLGLPVPQGFTITTEACTKYYEDGRQINPEIQAQIMEYIEKMEKITGKKFGDLENPLLVSVRSGARASMPGMMDTILNLGLNEEVAEVMAKKSGNPRWAYDCYRRFIQMYSDVVMEVGKKYFELLIDKMKEEKGVKLGRRADRRGSEGAGQPVQGRIQVQDRRGFPLRSQGTADGRHQGGLPLLGQPPRQRLSPRQRHPLFLGHCRQRPDDGLRQHGRYLRHRRCLHPQPRHRRKGPLRRVPDERAGRGRRRRRAHPQPHRRS